MKKKEEVDYRSRMTVLNDQQAEEFINKHHKLIFSECNKRRQLPGIDIKDLHQECTIRLLSGFHLFDNNKSTERTWVANVVRKTLNSIWNKYIKTQKKVCHIPGKNNEQQAVYDLPLEMIEEKYSETPDGRPAYGTISFSPEEAFQVLQVLEILKSKLPHRTYNYIASKLIPDLPEQIELNDVLDNVELKDLEEYEIWSIMGKTKEKKLRKLSQIADILVNSLGYDEETILDRKLTLDIVTE